MDINAILLKIALPLLSKIGKRTIKSLTDNNEVLEAARATGEHFPEYAGITFQLRVWSDRTLHEVLAKIRAGKEVEPDSVVSDFIKTSDFDAGDATENKAREIVGYFLQHLENALLRGEHGLVVHH